MFTQKNRPPCPPFSYTRDHDSSNLATYFQGLAEEYGDIVRISKLFKSYIVSHPDLIKQIAITHHDGYGKKMFPYRRLKRLIGDGMVTQTGERWAAQRKCLAPLFMKRHFITFADAIFAKTESMLARWKHYAESQTVFDIEIEMMRLILEITGATLFHYDLDDMIPQIISGVHFCNRYAMRAPFLFTYTPTIGNWRFQHLEKKLDGYIKTMTTDRRSVSPHARPDDVLTRLIQLEDQTHTGDLNDNAKTFLLTGHETTGTALAWTWYCLARHAPIYDRLQNDIQRVLGKRSLRVEDLNDLPYIEQIFAEVLRLYPPLWTIMRNSKQEQTLGAYDIPSSWVMLPPYTVHRHHQYWDHPEHFDPDRFSPQGKKAQHKFAYIPFGFGHRNCIASQLALLEAHIIIAMITQRYRITLAKNRPIEAVGYITLKAKKPIKVRIDEVL